MARSIAPSGARARCRRGRQRCVGAEIGNPLDRLQRVEQHVLHRGVGGRELRRPRDGRQVRRSRQAADFRAVAGHDDPAEQPAAARVLKRILDHRPAQQRQAVLVFQARASGAGEDDSENIHTSAPIAVRTRRLSLSVGLRGRRASVRLSRFQRARSPHDKR